MHFLYYSNNSITLLILIKLYIVHSINSNFDAFGMVSK